MQDDYNNSYFINERITKLIPPVSQNYIDSQIKIETKEIERWLIEFRESKFYNDKLKGKIVILVNDGIATGATIIAAARWIKNKQNCKSLIVAVSVATAKANYIIDNLKVIADKMIIPYVIEEFFGLVNFIKTLIKLVIKRSKK